MKKDDCVYATILDAKDDLNSIPPNTLATYCSRMQIIEVGQLSSTAWQIFQNSEMIQKMSNKELEIGLTNC